MAAQHDRLCERGPAPYIYIKGSLLANNNMILIFKGYSQIQRY